jgi:hypothetical protein
MIYQGLDEDEFAHIEQVKQQEYEATVSRLKDEGEQIQSFRDAVAVRSSTTEDETKAPVKAGGRMGKARVGTQKKTSQLQMLSGLIKKRKTPVNSAGAADSLAGAGAADLGAKKVRLDASGAAAAAAATIHGKQATAASGSGGGADGGDGSDSSDEDGGLVGGYGSDSD